MHSYRHYEVHTTFITGSKLAQHIIPTPDQLVGVDATGIRLFASDIPFTTHIISTKMEGLFFNVNNGQVHRIPSSGIQLAR